MKKGGPRIGGFTLLEISLAVVIGLMMLSLALPSMRGLFAEQRLRERMELFESFVGRAAALAHSSRKEVRLRWVAGGVQMVPEQDLPPDGAGLEEGSNFFSLDKEEVLELTRTAARDPKPLAEWFFWPEGIREPVRLDYEGPGGTWSLQFGALLAEPEVLGVHVR